MKGQPNPNKGKSFPAEILTSQEARALIKVCSNRTTTGIRNRALIILLYRGGLRISEALSLKPKDLDSEAGSVHILKGKRSKPRTVGLETDSFTYVQRWLDKRKQRGIDGRAPVFCTFKGQPIKTSYVRALLKRLAEKAGIEKRVHPHGLRHTFAAELAREGHPMNMIQKQLGHSSLATTSLYLDHISPQQLIDAMKSRKFDLEAD